MAQNVDITISETVQQVTVDLETTVVEVDVTIAPEELAKIEATNAQASATAAATSEQNAATSESNAQTSANNASTSEDNAADSASDAEKHAQETGSFTDSDGVAFDNGAQGFKDQAEAARDEITNKIDFSTTEDFDTLRKKSGVFEGVNDVRLLYESLTPYTARLIIRKGQPITSNTNTVPFTDLIDGEPYEKFTDLTEDTSGTNNSYSIFVTGRVLERSSPFQGIILGIDSNNYFEIKWRRFNNVIFRYIEGGIINFSESGSIGNDIRGMRYELEINLGGQFGRTSLQVKMSGATEQVFTFDSRFPAGFFGHATDMTFIAALRCQDPAQEANLVFLGDKFV